MKRALLTIAIAAATVFAPGLSLAQDETGRVLSLGGSVTEIVYALGAGDRLIARDSTSSFPPEAEALPDVGYVRALSPEGVLAVSPDLIVAEEGAGPPETIEVLTDADIPFVTVPEVFSATGIAEKVQVVGKALGRPAEADALAAQIVDELEAVTQTAEGHAGAPKRVLFVLSTQGGRIMASGTDTAAAAMIEMAGGENAITAFEGYKPLTDEAVIEAAPDVILMMDRGGDHGSSVEELVKFPAVASTPAGANRAVIRMDGLYLLGFGPRTADAVGDLSDALYGG